MSDTVGMKKHWLKRKQTKPVEVKKPRFTRRKPKKETEPFSKTVRDWIATIILVISAFTAFFGFYWPNIVVPKRIPPAPTITVTIHQVAETAIYSVLDVVIDLHNTSKTRVYNLASWFEVYGIFVRPKSNTNQGFQKKVDGYVKDKYYLTNGEIWPLRRDVTLEKVSRVLLSCGKAFDQNDTWEADQQQTEDFLVFVPKNHQPAYDVIQCHFGIATANTKDDTLIKTPIVRDGDDFNFKTQVSEATFCSWYQANNWLEYKTLTPSQKEAVAAQFGYIVSTVSTEISLWPSPSNSSLKDTTTGKGAGKTLTTKKKRSLSKKNHQR